MSVLSSVLAAVLRIETVKDALKVTIAFSLCTAVPLMLHWEQPSYALFTAVMLATPYLGFSIDRGILRIVGTFCAVIASMSLIALYAQDWPAFIVASTILVIVTCYFAAGDFYPYAFVVTCFFTIIIAGLSLLTPESTWELAKFVAQQTIAATIITVAVYSVFWPNKAGRNLSVLYGDITRLSRETLESCLTSTSYEAAQALVQRKRHDAMILVGNTREILFYASRDSSDIRRNYAHYQQLNSAMRDVALNSAVLATAMKAPDAPRLPDDFHAALTEFIREGQRLLKEFRFKLASEDAVEMDSFERSHQALRQLWHDFLAELKTFKMSVLEAAALGGILVACDQLHDCIQRIYRQRDIIHRKRDPDRKRRQTRRNYLSAIQLPSTSGHYQIRRALQAGACCFVGFVVFYVTDPPMGTNLWVSAVIGGAINSLVPYMRFSHLMIGTVLGFFFGTILLYGMLIFLPNDSLFWLLICAAPFVFINAYIYSHKQTVVIGLLGNLMFAMLVYIGDKADYSIEDWYSMILSSLAGFLVTGVMISLVWPIRPRREFKTTCLRVLDECAQLLAFWDEHSPREEGSEPLLASMDRSLSSSMSRANLWLGLVNWKKRRELQKEEAEAIVIALEAFSLRMCAIERARNHFPHPEKVLLITPVLRSLRRALREHCQVWVRAMESETLPDAQPDFSAHLRDLEEHGQRFRRQRKATGTLLPPEDASALLGLLSRYRSCILAMQRLDEVMRNRHFLRTPLSFY